MRRVTAAQRHSPQRPCPVCNGHTGMQQGAGTRCFGFVCDGGDFVICTRDERAGQLPLNEAAQGYMHRVRGACRCGGRHALG